MSSSLQHEVSEHESNLELSKEQNSKIFERLIENEKLVQLYNQSEDLEEDADLADDADEAELDLKFGFEENPSPEPQPDLQEILRETNFDDGWSFVDPEKMKETVDSSVVVEQSEQSSQKTLEQRSESSVIIEKSVKKKSTKKSKSEHISVHHDGSGDSAQPTTLVSDQGISISKLKSVYDTTSSNTHRQSAVQSPTISSSSESRVFAKVCVANLRRSFADLTDLAEFNGKLNQIRSSSEGRKLEKSSFSKFDQLDKKKSVEIRKEQQAPTVETQKVCRSCGKEVFLVELVKAEKSSWHKNCFRCSDCSKQLKVDTYSSHEGKLYCKPHFKALFQPKAVFEEEGDSRPSKLEVIIRESQPTELPAGCARASDQQSTGLEDLQVDVRSKFEMFENYKESKEKPELEIKPEVKRSASVLARLAKYEGKDELGVPNDELHGDLDGVESSTSNDEDDGNDMIRSEMRRKLKNPAAAMAEIMQCKQMEEVRAKWEEGMNSKQEEQSENRKAEMAKFRSRLCQGKSNQLKEMYEKQGDAPAESQTATLTELEELRLEKAKRLRDMFEKGEVRNEDEQEETEQSLVEKESAVFESGVAKQSRNLFKEMDQNLTKIASSAPSPRTPSENRLNKQNLFNREVGDVVRSSDKMEDILPVQTEDLSSKFKFFETYERQQEEQKKQKKEFRFTPPRDKGEKTESPEREVYRDPNIMSEKDKHEDTIVKSKTTSKMLNVFRQLEEQSQTKDVVTPRQGLKQFTPPRDPREASRVLDDNSESEEEDEDEYEEEEEEQVTETKEDAFLKEVGSMAKARSLRLRFERWEEQENAKNKEEEGRNGIDSTDSIESARELKAKFELLQQQQKDVKKPEVKVRRFVAQELQNNCPSSLPVLSSTLDMSSDSCAFCEKKVYAMEKVEANSKIYHKNCFRCSVCKSVLRMDSFTFHHCNLYCKNHFKQLFKIKGNYDEGFGHETQKQIWAKKQAEKENQ